MTDTSAELHSLDDVKPLFKALRLSHAGNYYAEHFSDPDFMALSTNEKLYVLLTEEVKARRYNGYLRRKKQSGMPERQPLLPAALLLNDNKKSLDTVENLAQTLWTDYTCCAITGPAGVGKTSLAMSMSNIALQQGKKAKFYDYSLQMMRLCDCYNSDIETYTAQLETMAAVNLIVLDDFLLRDPRGNEILCLKNLLDLCYEKQCSILLTSQLDVKGWIEKLGESKSSSAVKDRLLGKPFIIELSGKSKRHGRGGLLPVNTDAKAGSAASGGKDSGTGSRAGTEEAQS